MIRISPVRLVDQKGEQLGLVDTPEAMRMAQAVGLDLVEVVANSRPPICKIMDYGKHKYDQSKKEAKARQHGGELKEIRLGRSLKIDPHDVKIRVDQARRFLIAGHKVQIVQRFRGREIVHKQMGEERMFQICQDLSDVSKIDMAPKTAGRAITLLLSPDKDKIKSIKSRMIQEDKEKEILELARIEAEIAAQNEADDLADAKEDAVEEKIEKKKKQKGPRDNRASNPVDDEIADLLG